MNFKYRKEKALKSRATEKSYQTAAEVEKDQAPSSEEIIESVGLPNGLENSLFKAIQKLKNKFKLSSKFLGSEHLELPDECRFKYRHKYDRLKENLDSKINSLVVFEETRIVGFGITKHSTSNKTKIDIIDVDKFSRRSAGLSAKWNYKKRTFTVGIGHFIVSELISNLRGTLITNATNSRSRFIFKSFGFKNYTSNPCDLKLDQTSQ